MKKDDASTSPLKVIRAAVVTFRRAVSRINQETLLHEKDLLLCGSRILDDVKNAMALCDDITGNEKERFEELSGNLPMMTERAICALWDYKKKSSRLASQMVLSATLEKCAEFLNMLAEKLTHEKADGRRDPLLDGLHEINAKLEVVENNSAIAAARKLKELKAKQKGGKKGAAIAKEERREDPVRKAILDSVKAMINERDEGGKFRDNNGKPRSDNWVFQTVANKHLDADGKPLMSKETIGRTYRREKEEDEKRGKYDRKGKKRGPYMTKF